MGERATPVHDAKGREVSAGARVLSWATRGLSRRKRAGERATLFSAARGREVFGESIGPLAEDARSVARDPRGGAEITGHRREEPRALRECRGSLAENTRSVARDAHGGAEISGHRREEPRALRESRGLSSRTRGLSRATRVGERRSSGHRREEPRALREGTGPLAEDTRSVGRDPRWGSGDLRTSPRGTSCSAREHGSSRRGHEVCRARPAWTRGRLRSATR